MSQNAKQNVLCIICVVESIPKKSFLNVHNYDV